jgi:hypothetical protein
MTMKPSTTRKMLTAKVVKIAFAISFISFCTSIYPAYAFLARLIARIVLSGWDGISSRACVTTLRFHQKYFGGAARQCGVSPTVVPAKLASFALVPSLVPS